MSDVEQKLEEIEQELENDLDQAIEDTEESDGLLTKKGRLLDRAEWHAFVLGFTPIGTGFILPSPIGELFIVAELMMLRTGFNKKMRGEDVDGHLGDVMDEVAYTFAASFLAALIFELISLRYGFGGLTSIDLSQVVLAMFGGA